MAIFGRIEKVLIMILQWFWSLFITIHEYKNIFQKRNLFKGVVLTDEQKKQIDSFYLQNYGKKIPYWWHRLYQSYTGKFDHMYIPEIIFSTKLEPLSNSRMKTLPYEDKNMLPVLFDNCRLVRVPKTYIMCVNGNYFDESRTNISQEQAFGVLTSLQNGNYSAVVKATVDTSSGRDVRVLDLEGGRDRITQETIQSIVKKMGDNVVVQERIVPHESLKKLYPDAINTVRVVTYIIGDKVDAAPAALRIGRGGSRVDNAHAGGIFIGVSNDGRLAREAYTEYQKRFTVHPDTGIVFENYQIPHVHEIIELAKTLHQRIPMFRFVSWDFTIDSNDRIVLLETNLHSQAVWLAQMAHGQAFFGENTAEMLRLARR